MNTQAQQNGALAFNALRRTSHHLRSDGHEAAAAEVEQMALRLREILYTTTKPQEEDDR